MCNRRFAIALTATFGFLSVAGVSHGEGFVVVDDALVEAQVVQEAGGQVGACGIRVRATHSIGLQAMRTWDVTLYIAKYDSAGLAVDASSYDVDRAGAQPEARPAPTELAFSITGGTQILTAAEFRPSQTKGESLALIFEKGAGQIMTALETGTPVVLFFRPKGAETEVVIVSGKAGLHTVETFGQCMQHLRGAKTEEPWPKMMPSDQ